MDEFRTKLFQIGRELTTDDLDGLKYLCKDIIPAGKAEFITKSINLLQELERIGKLSEDNPHILAKYLASIDRIDLRDKLLVAAKPKEEEELIEKFHSKMRIKQKASQFEILDGDIVEDGENRVQAHLAVITSKDQVEQVLAELKKKDPDVAKATHNIWAYKIFNTERNAYDENCDDDGDDSSGARVLRFLQRTQATDVMVVVSCWYETTAEDFGENRFKCIQKSILDLLLTYGKVRIPSARIKKFYEEIEYTPFEKAKEQETPKFYILHGETIKDRKSTFQAHLADITSREQVDQVLEELMKDRKIAKATYNMWACRVYDEKKKSYFEEGNDDGENLGGERLLHLLQRRDAKNVVIIVTRWHGGIHLGNDRFKHINKCASDLLQQRREEAFRKVKVPGLDEWYRDPSTAQQQPEVQEQAQPLEVFADAVASPPSTSSEDEKKEGVGIRDLNSHFSAAEVAVKLPLEGSSTVSKIRAQEEFIKEKLGLNSGDKIDDFFGKCEHFALDQPQHRVFVSELEETFRKLKHSIGAILALNISSIPECGATCFRIGTKYVITNKHVVHQIKNLGIQWSSCYVDFNYGEQGSQPAADSFRFNFATNPELVSSEELDYAILELNPEDRNLPPSLVDPDSGFNIAPPGRQLQRGDRLSFIGHPGGLKKQIDVSCPIKLQQDTQKHLHNDYVFCMIQKAFNHPDIATYDVSTFFEESSGSPGLLMKAKLLVVLHSGGIPLQGTNNHYVLECGPLMSSVVKDVIKQIKNRTVENVTRELDEFFGGSTSSTFNQYPVQMEIDEVPGLQ